MKAYLSISLAGVALLFASGCQSGRDYSGDEAKTVAHVIASESGSAVAFGDHQGIEHILSSIDQSGYLNFGIVLDGEKHIVASYFKPDASSQKEVVMAKVLQSLPEGLQSHGLSFAVAPIGSGGQVTGYVIIGATNP